DLEFVSDYAWGPAVLTFIYKGLSPTTAPGTKVVTGYMILLQVTNDYFASI
ncbi:hypothetical protein A2U01_0056876, partial [Trifolium medium]|nr:hypothetical protein [Trifolium medium]